MQMLKLKITQMLPPKTCFYELPRRDGKHLPGLDGKLPQADWRLENIPGMRPVMNRIFNLV